MNLPSRISLLVFIVRNDPKLWVIIHPDVPAITNDTRNVMAAVIIKFIIREIKDSNKRKELDCIGKSLYQKYFDEHQRNNGNTIYDFYQKANGT